ncbi:hypothetical protein GCM10009692_28310 [Leucobacter aridicollis]
MVVPVGPVCHHLPAQLEALAAQAVPAGAEMELILCCNGSAVSAVAEWAGQVAWSHAWRVRVHDASAVRGPSYARNAGWRLASAERILFCDSDDVVSPRWAASLTEALDDADVVGGEYDYMRLNHGPIATWGQNMQGLPIKFGHLPFAPSGNLGARRAALDLLEGFDESLERCEDVDFSWRAAYAGLTVGFAAGALLHVRRRITLRDLYVQARDDASFDYVSTHATAAMELGGPRGLSCASSQRLLLLFRLRPSARCSARSSRPGPGARWGTCVHLRGAATFPWYRKHEYCRNSRANRSRLSVSL